MPEAIEAEIYRRSAAGLIGRTVCSVDVDVRQRHANEIVSILPGCRVAGVGRHGKQVWLDLVVPGSGAVMAAEEGEMAAGEDLVRLGIHFGMTGRLRVDAGAPIEALAYSSAQWKPEWDRLTIAFEPAGELADFHHENQHAETEHGEDGHGDNEHGEGDREGGSLVVNDPRRWAKFVLDPDLSRLGPDVFDVDVEGLRGATAGRTAPIKAVLLNQSVVAGLGNMMIDELLLRSGVDPRRAADDIGDDDYEQMATTLGLILPEMLAGGGCHTGMLHPGRRGDLGPCPVCDGGALRRDRVGGRTTVWCPNHQL